MRLYYMTAERWATVILRDHRLKLSRFSEANDPFELRLIDSRDREARRYAELIHAQFDRSVGFICFSESWRSPVMWAHYAEKHTGLALAFEVPDPLVTKISYTNAKLRVPFGPHLPRHGLSADLLTKVRTTKSKEWEYEREHRVEARLTAKDPVTGLYYTDFGPQLALRELIIGHRCSWTAAQAKDRVGEVTHPVRILRARPAFGRFEMVQQKSVRPVTIKPSVQAR